jgi:hypothetical protein
MPVWIQCCEFILHPAKAKLLPAMCFDSTCRAKSVARTLREISSAKMRGAEQDKAIQNRYAQLSRQRLWRSSAHAAVIVQAVHSSQKKTAPKSGF